MITMQFFELISFADLNLTGPNVDHPWNGVNRPVFHSLPEPNRAWLLVVYFSR